MANVHTLNEINNGAPLVSGNKLGDLPFNRYPSSRTELENQLACVKHDLDIALSSGIQLGTRNSLLIKNNESFSERVCQLEDEAREFKNEINQKEISLASTKNEIAIKLEEIQALHLRVEELEQDVSLAQKRLSEMDSLKRKSELEYIKLSDENISLELAKMELEDTLAKKKDELMRVRDDLLSAQKAVIEKDSLLQETNTLLLEQILKTSSESKQNKVIGGDKGLEKVNEITSPETTSVSPNSSFFQHAIIFVVVLLIIYFLWCVFSRLYSSYNEEKNIPNYKIPLNRNQGYAFPIRHAKEPKDRTASYETLPYGYE